MMTTAAILILVAIFWQRPGGPTPPSVKRMPDQTYYHDGRVEFARAQREATKYLSEAA